MNNPLHDLDEELELIAREGFDFVDLTLEPDRAMPADLDAAAVRRRLRETGLGAVGHTAFYLPIVGPIPALKEAAFGYFRECADFCAAIGAKLINVHPFTRIPLYGREWIAQRHVEVLGELLAMAESRGLRLMLENMPPYFNQPGDLRPVFQALPGLGFHLDVGHANLEVPVNIAGKLLDALHDRLAHVHINDNFGREDLHLPLGAGRINWPWVARTLRRHGYDGTVTLEIFSPDRGYLLASKEKWERIWEEAGT